MKFALLRSLYLGGALLLGHAASAAPLLYYTPAETTYGLRKTGFDLFSQKVVTTFGADNVIELPTFDTASEFADASVLFVNARGQNPAALSAAERQNLKTFIDAGGAVFFVGEHGGWSDWDNSFLGLFGAEFTTWGSINAALPSGTAPEPFVSTGQLALSAPGAITGAGQPLYGLSPYTMAATFGPSQNAIAFLDTYPLSGAHSSHLELHVAIADWMYTTGAAYETAQQSPSVAVPDATSTGALCTLALALLAAARRRQHMTT